MDARLQLSNLVALWGMLFFIMHLSINLSFNIVGFQLDQYGDSLVWGGEKEI